jgi:hypothetical protein
MRSVATLASLATLGRHVIAKTNTNMNLNLKMNRVPMVPFPPWIRSLSIRGGGGGSGEAKVEDSPQSTYTKLANPAPGSRKFRFNSDFTHLVTYKLDLT